MYSSRYATVSDATALVRDTHSEGVIFASVAAHLCSMYHRDIHEGPICSKREQTIKTRERENKKKRGGAGRCGARHNLCCLIYTYGNTQSRTKYINCVCVSVYLFFHVAYIRALNGKCASIEEGSVGSKVARHWKVAHGAARQYMWYTRLYYTCPGSRYTHIDFGDCARNMGKAAKGSDCYGPTLTLTSRRAERV